MFILKYHVKEIRYDLSKTCNVKNVYRTKYVYIHREYILHKIYHFKIQEYPIQRSEYDIS